MRRCCAQKVRHGAKFSMPKTEFSKWKQEKAVVEEKVEKEEEEEKEEKEEKEEEEKGEEKW